MITVSVPFMQVMITVSIPFMQVVDLHRHKIDHITIPSGRGPNYGVLRRVDDVSLENSI
jgi:hypothetical protein